MASHHLSYWLAALHLPGIGPRTVLGWLEHFTTIEALFRASMAEWQAAHVKEQHIHFLRHPNWKLVEEALLWANQTHHHLIAFDADDYPPLLKEMVDPPLVMAMPASAKQ